MSDGGRQLDAIDRWLIDVQEGAATEAETARMNALLAGDADLRAYVVRRLTDEALLAEVLRISEAESLIGSGLFPPEHVGPLTAERRRFHWLTPSIAAAVSAVAAVFLVAVLWPFWQRPAPHEPVAAAPVPGLDEPTTAHVLDTEGVAILTQAINVDWTPGERPLRVNDRVAAGRVRIASGLLQLEFFSGATVVLEGPADLEVVSAMRCNCRRGKLRADVPPQAIGFTIGSGDIEVVDLGTEFAMRVEESGAGEVHVLQGEVELQQPGKETKRLLKDGEAVRFTDAGELSQLEADGAVFADVERVSELEVSRRESSSKRWLAHSSRWASDPAIALYYNFENHQPASRRLQSAMSESPANSEGAIVGCRWVEGRFEGKHALEFKRTSDRVRVQVEAKFDSLSLVAWLRIEGFDQWYSSLLLSDGYEPGKVHWQLTQEGRLKFSIGLDGQYASPPIFKPSDLGRWAHLATVYDHQAQEVRHYVDGALISTHAISTHLPLTIGSAEIGNWNAQRNKKNAVRSLNGLIDEFAVFRRALTQQEISESHQAGNPYP